MSLQISKAQSYPKGVGEMTSRETTQDRAHNEDPAGSPARFKSLITTMHGGVH